MELKTILKIVLFLALADFIPVIIMILPMLKRSREIKYLENCPDVISVEAEIIEIHMRPINSMDTQYDVKLYYEVGYEKYYKDVILINKQSVRIGQTVTLMCDSLHPEKAMMQNLRGLSGERFGLKSLVFNLVVASIVILVDFLLQISDILFGIGSRL